MTLQRISYLQAHPASGETIANHKADLGTFCLSASLTMTLQRISYLQAHPASGETIANHKADLGTFCLSASLTMTLQRRSYLQAHPASGETGVDFYPASPLYSEQSGYDKRELENGSRNVRAKGMLEVLAEEQYPVYKL